METKPGLDQTAICPISPGEPGQNHSDYRYLETLWCLFHLQSGVRSVVPGIFSQITAQLQETQRNCPSLPLKNLHFPARRQNGADEVLLYEILYLVSFVQSAQRLSGGDAYKLKLIELVLLFLPQANKLRIHDHICLWSRFLPIRDLSPRA